MTDITVRPLAEDEWETYRDVRLRALKESPEAFAASVDKEADYGEDFWRQRLTRSRRLIAEEDDGSIVGVVSTSRLQNDESAAHVSELFGLWVTPELRGTGVAWKLVSSGVDQARRDGFDFIVYWVGTDNGRAVAFASSFGFRPTDSRRPMTDESGGNGSAPDDEPEDEMAMIYPLGADPGAAPSSVL